MAKYRYLKQHKTNYVTMWAPVAAKRADQVEISEEEAQELLKEQQKTHQQRIADGTFVAPAPEPIEETGVVDEEAKVDMTEPPDTPPEEVKTDSTDDEIKMLEEIRVVGKGKARIESYMLEKYSIDVDRRLKLNELVDQAIAARTADLDEQKKKAVADVAATPPGPAVVETDKPEVGIPVE